MLTFGMQALETNSFNLINGETNMTPKDKIRKYPTESIK